MCSGIEYLGKMHLWRDVDVTLPVLMKDGSIRWLKWGERHGVQSAFVQGPCARLDSIQAGKWQRFNPMPVKIPITRYMERNQKCAPYWVKVEDGQYLQGLVATVNGEQRVYVVTVDAPQAFRHVQDRWPRVIG
ncbi:MAG: hypothetical protein Q8K94_08865 [Moraxellaceae bacterium]|nr:hypothetical protein [Moraxellaceae bacterium]MDP1776704.1 hypothetical protein [Moraxellaceae bacterium]